MAQESAKKNKREVSRLLLVLVSLCFGLTALPASAIPYQLGDVFVAIGNGKVQHRNAAGLLLETLDTGRGGFTTGMAFDSLSNLYVTNFGAGTVSRFNSSGGLIGTFGSGYSGSPESIVFDRNGNAYVGAVNGDNRIRKFDPLGNPLAQFSVVTERVGTDWIDLAPDQCTIFYTSEGLNIKRFDVCTNTQLSNFNSLPLPGSNAFALRILPDGGVLVANTSQIVRLNATGNLIQTYDSAGENCWFALNLDPDGKSFWSASYCSSNVHKFDIQTGADLLSFNTGTGSLTVFGVVVFGELSASRPISLSTTFGIAGRSGTFSDPVNTSTGNYYFSRPDLVIPGRGLVFNFTRSYNSLDSYNGPLGAGWTHSYNIFVRKNASGTVTVKEADGHEVLFIPTGGGSYTPGTPGVFDNLTENVNGSFTLSRKNQTRLSFSQSGKLLAITDRNGNVQTLLYDGAGNLHEITDTVGRSVVLTYDGNNRIVQITDPIGRSVTFSYDGSNNLVEAVDPAGGTTKSTYDSNHRIASITLPNNQLPLQSTYDAIGRVISQTNGRGFTSVFAYGTPNPTDTTITDARGTNTVHTSDASLRIVKITDAAAGIVSFTYDASNNRKTVTNQNAKTTSFTYDVQGNITGITDPLTNAVAFTYDTKNNLLTATNAKARTTTFTYDVKGNLKTIQDALGNTTTIAYDGFGQVASKTDARGNTTTFSYDSLGNVTRITDALSHSTTLAYDGIGRLTSITDPNGHTATATYDALSRLLKITDPLGNQTKFDYDPVGNLLKITDANLNATSYAYDATNNLVSVTDALGHITRYSYDANNNRATFTNAKGNPTSYVYDALNRLGRITDPLSFVTAYTYDPVGNVATITDAKGQTNAFTYDALNRLLSIAYADGKSVAYAYDANGNRTSMVDSHGTTAYSYDALDRLISVSHPGGKVVSYAYDAVGNRQSVDYPDGKLARYSYDGANRLAGVTDWLGRATTYTYDAASNLTATAYPNQAALGFTYDAANRLTEVRNIVRKRGDDDSDKDDDEDDDPMAIASFRYLLDSVGNRLQVTDGKGKVTRYTYDLLYELTSVSTSKEEGDKDDDDKRVVRFTYDPVGNRLSLASGKNTVQYSYDAADRLLTADTATFTYDANGNQTSKTQTATGQPLIYTYDAANRLISVNGGRINSSFSYDGDGNRVSQAVGVGTYSYLNDVATALPVVLQESGPDGNISYAYGLGLISETSPAFDFFYHYDGLGSVVALTNPLGKLKAKYVYDAWGETLRSTPDHRIGTKNKFRFTGEALDPGTQLYYLRARYYDAAIGRFIARDPFSGFAALAANSLNGFVYAANNPVQYVDPLGLLSWSTVVSKVEAVGIAGLSAVTFSASTVAKGWTGFANALTGGRLQALDSAATNLQQASAVTLIGSIARLGGTQLSLQEAIADATTLSKIGDLASLSLSLGGAVYDLPKSIGKIAQAQNTINVNNLLNIMYDAQRSNLGPAAAQLWQVVKITKTGYGAYSYYNFLNSPVPKTSGGVTAATGK